MPDAQYRLFHQLWWKSFCLHLTKMRTKHVILIFDWLLSGHLQCKAASLSPLWPYSLLRLLLPLPQPHPPIRVLPWGGRRLHYTFLPFMEGVQETPVTLRVCDSLRQLWAFNSHPRGVRDCLVKEKQRDFCIGQITNVQRSNTSGSLYLWLFFWGCRLDAKLCFDRRNRAFH